MCSQNKIKIIALAIFGIYEIVYKPGSKNFF